MFYLTANFQRMEEFMHFKKILSASILASALIFCIPQAIYALHQMRKRKHLSHMAGIQMPWGVSF